MSSVARENKASDAGGRRRYSSILSRYVCVGFLVPFVCSVLVFIALFLLRDVLDNISDFLDKGIAPAKIALYYFALQPANLVNVMPVAVLLGTSFLTMTLGRNNELTAMRASGLSLAACARPIWICSVIASVLVFAINESWGAKCQQKAADIYYSTAKKKKAVGRFSFRNPLDRRDWSVEEIDGDGNANSPVVRQYRENGRSQTLIAAQKAVRTPHGWLFKQGFMQNYGEDGMTPDGNEVYFEQQLMPFNENLRELSELGKNSEMMNIASLYKALDNPFMTSERKQRLMRVLIWHRLTVPLASLVAALLAFSLTISTGRKGAVKGFAMAVALLVLFYVAGQLGVNLGRNGYLTPFLGGALPQLLFLCGAVYSMYRRQ